MVPGRQSTKLVIGQASGPLEGDLRAGGDRETNIRASQRRVQRGYAFLDLFRHDAVDEVDVGRRHHHLDALLDGDASHLEARLQVHRAIVYGGQNVAVEVDHRTPRRTALAPHSPVVRDGASGDAAIGVRLPA